MPPGWDEWYVAGNAHRSYDYTLNENGRAVAYGNEPRDYLNDVLTDKAVQVIRQASSAGQPFFVYVLPYTPHSPSVAAPRHVDMFAHAALPRTPAFDEADVGDKPAFVRRMPPLDEKHVRRLEDEYQRRLRVAAGDRRHGRAHRRRARGGRRARQHLRHLQLGQRLPSGRAPPARRQGLRLRGGHPRAGDRARAGRAGGPAGRGHGPEQRLRPDLRRDRRHRGAGVRRRALVPAPVRRPGAGLARRAS